jgi:uncharacterized NAD-dependent epimerase/dehydratase family protein
MQAKPQAIILTNGLLGHSDAKTAHGLIRGTDRYEIKAVIDRDYKGKDAGEVLDGKFRNIPIFDSVETAIEQLTNIQWLIIGVATVGGVLPADMLEIIKVAIQQGLSVVNGLHEYLSEKPGIPSLAQLDNVQLIDIRKPKPIKELHFWKGEIYQVTAPVIAVLGMDCAMGKRTTARMLCAACEKENIPAQMIFTRQTGWLQGGQYGFIFDSTLNDFISGELENAIITCWKETNPSVIFIEGQSALRNPSGPCGTEFLISGNARHVILIHAPKRKYFDNDPQWGKIPPVESEIEIIKKFGSTVIALAINTEDCTEEEGYNFQASYENSLKIPVILPVQQGVDKLIPIIKNLVK